MFQVRSENGKIYAIPKEEDTNIQFERSQSRSSRS